jgi:hypothetical protein
MSQTNMRRNGFISAGQLRIAHGFNKKLMAELGPPDRTLLHPLLAPGADMRLWKADRVMTFIGDHSELFQARRASSEQRKIRKAEREAEARAWAETVSFEIGPEALERAGQPTAQGAVISRLVREVHLKQHSNLAAILAEGERRWPGQSGTWRPVILRRFQAWLDSILTD